MEQFFGYPIDYNATGGLFTFIFTAVLFFKSFFPQDVKYGHPKEELEALENTFHVTKEMIGDTINHLEAYASKRGDTLFLSNAETVGHCISRLKFEYDTRFDQHALNDIYNDVKTRPLISLAQNEMIEIQKEVLAIQKELKIIIYNSLA